MGKLKIPFVNKLDPAHGILLVAAGLAAVYFLNSTTSGATPSRPLVKMTPAKNIGIQAVLRDRVSAFTSRAYEVTTTNTTPDDPVIRAYKDQVLRNITTRAKDITVLVNSMATINAEIDTHTSEFNLVKQQKAAGVITDAQIAVYLQQMVTTIAGKLNIALNDYLNTAPQSPDYYQDYYKQYQQYLNQQNQSYYDYYQPSYQYYPNQQYNYYQPYQYQYPSPYMSPGTYPQSTPNYSNQYQQYIPQYYSQYYGGVGSGYGSQYGGGGYGPGSFGGGWGAQFMQPQYPQQVGRSSYQF